MKKLVDIIEGLLDVDIDDFKPSLEGVAKEFEWLQRMSKQETNYGLLYHEVARYAVDRVICQEYFKNMTPKQQTDYVIYMDYANNYPGLILCNIEDVLDENERGERIHPEFAPARPNPDSGKKLKEILDAIEAGNGENAMNSSRGYFNWYWGGIDDDYEAILDTCHFGDRERLKNLDKEVERRDYLNQALWILKSLSRLGIIESNKVRTIESKCEKMAL